MAREKVFYWKCDCDLSVAGKQQSYFADKYSPATVETARAAARDFAGTDQIDFAHLSVDGNHFAYRFVHNGKAYFLRTDDGRGDDDYMLAESAILTRLGAAGLPVPALYETSISMARHPFRYQIMDCLDAPPLIDHYKAGMLDLDAIAVQSGDFLAELHRIQLSGFGFIDTARLAGAKQLRGIDPTWRAYFHKCLENHLAYLETHRILPAGILPRIRRTLETHGELLETDRGVLLHRDFAIWNLLGSVNRIEAVIDWDDAVIGDPADDIGMVNCFMDEAYMETLLRAYARVHPVDERFRRKVSLYTLRNMLWKTVIRHYMGYFDKDSSFFLSKNSEGISLKDFGLKKIKASLEALE